MKSVDNSQKPQLFVIAQKGHYLQGKSDSYLKKYKSVIDHLCQCIAEDGKLDLHTKKVKTRDDFDSYVSSLRDHQVDSSRPFSFLFIAPEQQGRDANEELENTLNEIAHITRGENSAKKTASSSVIFVNDEDDNKALKFKDHSSILKNLSNKDGDLFKAIANIWDQFSHYSLKAKQEKLLEQVGKYADGLIEHLGATKIKATPKMSNSEAKKITVRQKSQDCKKSALTIKDLKPEQRAKIKAIDWIKAEELSSDSMRKTRYPTLELVKQGLSYGEAAEKLDKKPGTVFKTVNDFLLYPGDFMKGLDLEAVTISQ